MVVDRCIFLAVRVNTSCCIIFYKIVKRKGMYTFWAKSCDDDDNDDGEKFYFERNKSKWTSLYRIFTTTKIVRSAPFLFTIDC